MNLLFRKVAFNTFVQIVSKIITILLGLLATVLLTRYLGKESFGDYTFILTYLLIFVAVADWGTAIIGVREAASKKKGQRQILGTVFLIRLVLSLLATGAAVFLINFIPLQSPTPILVRQSVIFGSWLIVLLVIKTSFGVSFQTRLNFKNQAMVDIFIAIFSLGFSILAIVGKTGLTGLISAILAANIAGLAFAYILARGTIDFSLKPSWAMVKYLSREALPMGAVLVLFSVYNKIDLLLLASLKGSGPVGIYGLAYRLYDVLILGAAFFMQTMLPVISRALPLKELKRIYQICFDILLVMAASILVFTLVFAHWLVLIVGGNEFKASAFPLRILAFALFLAYFNHLTGFTIVAIKKQRLYFLISLTALIFNVAGNLILIPNFSYLGAALMTVLTEGLVLGLTAMLLYFYSGLTIDLFNWPKTIKEIISGRGKFF